MPETFSTPAASPTQNFSRNTNSPIRAFNTTTIMPESGTAPNQHSTPQYSPTVSFSKNTYSPIRAYG